MLWLVAVLAGSGAAHEYYSLQDGGATAVRDGPLREDLHPGWFAHASFSPTLNQTGWDILELRTNPVQTDEVQMFQAGYLEGFITYKQIYYYWYNNIKFLCVNKTDLCNKVNEYFTTNTEVVRRNSSQNLNDPYWYQIHLFYEQLRGLREGYTAAIKNEGGQNLTFQDFLLMNAVMEIPDLVSAFSNETQTEFQQHLGHCSVLIKIMPGFSDLYFGHTTWSSYKTMNRILKRYTFPIHMAANSTELIPGTQITFSSYPATIQSLDDFYIISSGLVTIETTLEEYNVSKYANLKAGSQVLEVVRTVIANRIAANGSEWNFYFSQRNSGTYNNQWMVIDLNKFKPGFQPAEGMLWIIEQLPGLIVAKDMTNYITGHGYWISYNIPFFKKTFVYSGSNVMEKKFGSWYSWSNYSRGQIFKREMNTVHDLNSMMSLLRYNHYKTDPYSTCQRCHPQQLPSETICARADLYPKNGTVVKPYSGYALFGGTDTKVSSYSLFIKGSLMLVVGGPTTSDGLPPFQWSKAQTQDYHLGQPDLWDFKPFIVAWKFGTDTTGGTTTMSPLSVTIYIFITLTLTCISR